MKKKYLMMMLAVSVSASMMFAGCGNKSEEVVVDAQSTQETQIEVADTVPETTEQATEAVVNKTESSNEAVEGEDYLSANGIKISPKVTEENCASELGLLSTEYDVYNCNFVTFDVGETETIVTVDFQLQHSDTYPNYYDFIVEFFDRYTGNNITKRPDVITESDIGETNLDARTDYTVSVVKEETVISEPVKYNSGKVSSDWRYKRVTYKITHPANYDGLVLMMASYDNQLLKTNNESFSLEDYKIMDKQEVYVGQFPRAEWDKELMVDREYWKFYTATDN